MLSRNVICWTGIVSIVLLSMFALIVLSGLFDPTACKCDINSPVHICAFHMWKDDTSSAIEVHHYCSPLKTIYNGKQFEIFQCALYDGPKSNSARLIGVEYVISHEVYCALPEAEQKLWHPHMYEVNAKLLIAPELSSKCNDGLMNKLQGSWGKSVHTWPDISQGLPLSMPRIAWAAEDDSIIKDRPDLIRRRIEQGYVPKLGKDK